MLGAAGVTVLMQPDAIKRRMIAERGEGRHEHRVGRWAIAGFRSFKHGPYAEVGDERFGMRQALAFRKDVRRRPLISVHLRDIEHRECPGEHASMVVVVTAVIIGLPGGRNLPPQHDSGGAFALAYLRAGILPLFVGSPEAVAIFSGEASRPKRQRVDPSVAFAGCDIGRAGGTLAVVEPWRTPFACASFNCRDDLGSDARIYAAALRRGGSVVHEGISAAGGASLSHRLNRPTRSGLPLPLPSRRAASVWSFLSRHEVAPVRPGFIPGGGAATCDARRRDRALAEPKRSGGRR